jgi:hypothetical protein
VPSSLDGRDAAEAWHLLRERKSGRMTCPCRRNSTNGSQTAGALCAAIALGSFAWSTGAAEDTPASPSTTTDSTIRPFVGERTTYQAPNKPLVIGGIVMFSVSYGASVIVAAAANTSFDNWLYVPIVAPWLDIGNRPSCGRPVQLGVGAESGARRGRHLPGGRCRRDGARLRLAGMANRARNGPIEWRADPSM